MPRFFSLLQRLLIPIAFLSLTGCAVVTVASVAVGAAVTVASTAVDVTVGVAKVGVKAGAKVVDVIVGD